jgi:glycosyltransferase involved in cell wall biosynthesis
MRRIAIMTPSLASGDAVSNDVLNMFTVLYDQNRNVQIFAEAWNDDLTNFNIKHINTLDSYIKDKNDLIIYHHSMGWEIGIEIFKRKNCIRAVKYHNVTPPEYFSEISSEFETACARGRQHIKALADINCELYISDSRYNMGELIEKGVPETNSLVIPPFHHIDRLNNLEAEPVILKKFLDGTFNILMVGRIAPNKGHLDLIQTFNMLQKYLPNTRLIIVGGEDPRLSVYNNKIREKINNLDLSNKVILTGRVSDSELKSYYLVSHCFVIISQHEGFCVPLVEAMSMKIPIVAYGSSAVTDTLDRAGIVWESNDPLLLATTIEFVLKDRDLQWELGDIGYNLYRERYDNQIIRKTFIETIGNL